MKQTTVVAFAIALASNAVPGRAIAQDWTMPADPSVVIGWRGVNDTLLPNPVDTRVISNSPWMVEHFGPLLAYAYGAAPLPPSGLQDVFGPISMLQSCSTAIEMIKNMTTEFGDRQAAYQAIANARTKFGEWAATQPDALKFYVPATLGKWRQDTQSFEIGISGRPRFSPSETATSGGQGRKDRTPASGLLAVSQVKTGNRYLGGLWVAGSSVAGCKIGTQEYALPIPSVLLTFGDFVYNSTFIDLHSADEVPRRGSKESAYPNAYQSAQKAMLPTVSMSASEAQEWVGANPERNVMLEVNFRVASPLFQTVRVADLQDTTGDDRTDSEIRYYRRAEILEIKIVDSTGVALATK